MHASIHTCMHACAHKGWAIHFNVKSSKKELSIQNQWTIQIQKSKLLDIHCSTKTKMPTKQI